MMDGAGRIAFSVAGADIQARFLERAAAAEAVAAAHNESDACNRGIFEQATQDAARFRLMAKYTDVAATYTLSRDGLQDIFLAQPFYMQQSKGLDVAAVREVAY